MVNQVYCAFISCRGNPAKRLRAMAAWCVGVFPTAARSAAMSTVSLSCTKVPPVASVWRRLEHSVLSVRQGFLRRNARDFRPDGSA
ncbi:hypothetical protein ATPR_1040 [Acetobacter tropicalis NBRC 101654]|uniref:Uncharacterized protein n=1 Tax=Acetobacter tropicalis NBRC 101654 TaxID=749388 RepID=F7VCE1_9PROT|nr:hypothetical protein ATPR_1040 [Acetobacter tropicalis NBRC 101654]